MAVAKKKRPGLASRAKKGKKKEKKPKQEAKKKPVCRARGRRGLNASEYVRKVVESRDIGCSVCRIPNVKAKLDEICKAMDSQNVKISAAQLHRDFKRHYENFKCSETKFRLHMRECLERD